MARETLLGFPRTFSLPSRKIYHFIDSLTRRGTLFPPGFLFQLPEIPFRLNGGNSAVRSGGDYLPQTLFSECLRRQRHRGGLCAYRRP